MESTDASRRSTRVSEPGKVMASIAQHNHLCSSCEPEQNALLGASASTSPRLDRPSDRQSLVPPEPERRRGGERAVTNSNMPIGARRAELDGVVRARGSVSPMPAGPDVQLSPIGGGCDVEARRMVSCR